MTVKELNSIVDELGCILSGVNFTNKLAEKYGVEVSYE